MLLALLTFFVAWVRVAEACAAINASCSNITDCCAGLGCAMTDLCAKCPVQGTPCTGPADCCANAYCNTGLSICLACRGTGQSCNFTTANQNLTCCGHPSAYCRPSDLTCQILAPTAAPTPAPTAAPTTAPTMAPTVAPTVAPTIAPTTAPTVAPTPPTVAPTTAPTVAPTEAPTVAPTPPTEAPTSAPTDPLTVGMGAAYGTLIALLILLIILALCMQWAWRRHKRRH